MQLRDLERALLKQMDGLSNLLKYADSMFHIDMNSERDRAHGQYGDIESLPVHKVDIKQNFPGEYTVHRSGFRETYYCGSGRALTGYKIEVA